jgi:histidyl-tRNA synthetase
MPYNKNVTEVNTQPLKGFRDFLPEEARKRQWLAREMIKVFERWGYEPIETPVLEPLEIFEGQIGEDEKMFFKFEDPGGRKVALRYDQTVPTCRFIGQYYDKIIFPFRRYQIQTAYRAEKPQKGRYREFVQADIDIFGIISPLADAECIALSIDLYKSLGFNRPVALINNRDLLSEIPYPVIAAVDKLRKIGRDAVLAEIEQKGYSASDAKKYLITFENLKPDQKLKEIINYLDNLGFTENYKFDPTLARSFSYSQGPIWEIIIEGYSTATFGGSVGGGERYDDLVEKISGKKIPATGIAFGFDRTLEAAEELKLLPTFEMSSKVLVSVFSADLIDKSVKLSKRLRDAGINTEIYPDTEVKLNKQLKYADKKRIPYVAIIGPDEAKNKQVTLKNLNNNSQESLTIEKLVNKLSSE